MKNPVKYLITSYPFKTYVIPYKKVRLQVIASLDQEPGKEPWEHVSVSLMTRCPNWDEMAYVKNLFWDDEELCIQIHPKKTAYVNLHNYCLHIWKPPERICELLNGA